MTAYQITCIKKNNRQSAFERIQSVGLNGGSQRYSQPQIVQWIDSGLYQFYVVQGGRQVKVITATSRHGHRYIKTMADGEEPNNLLSLPECYP